MRLQRGRTLQLIAFATLAMPLMSCEKLAASDPPKPPPPPATVLEVKTICQKLAEVFPTWAWDYQPETEGNRIDTLESVNDGGTFTAVFLAVCPGALD